jgi:hypothetical protein
MASITVSGVDLAIGHLNASQLRPKLRIEISFCHVPSAGSAFLKKKEVRETPEL